MMNQRPRRRIATTTAAVSALTQSAQPLWSGLALGLRIVPWMRGVSLTFGLLGAAACASAQGTRIPADAVDAFHAALKNKDSAAALSLLDPAAVVVEFGVADPTVSTFASVHLPFDIDVAAGSAWAIDSRRVGGEGDQRWVLTTYHVTGKQPDGSPIDQITLETTILQRSAGLFRIVHMHWSTNDVKFQALSQSLSTAASRPSGK